MIPPHPNKTLQYLSFNTQLGLMLAIGTDEALFSLTFVDASLEKVLKNFELKTCTSITAGITESTYSVKKELSAYFSGKLMEFRTPLYLAGTPFQQLAWESLSSIPYGNISTYAQQALAIHQPTACRAVANANAANPIAILVPCHRVITTKGDLGGYSGAMWRKKFLIEHERKYTR